MPKPDKTLKLNTDILNTLYVKDDKNYAKK
jgi:hypothetical protein